MTREGSYQERRDQILKEFSSHSHEEIIPLLLKRGQDFQDREQPSSINKECEIHNCQSRFWLDVKFINGTLSIKTRSESSLISGILSLLVELLSGLTPEEVKKSNLDDFFTHLGWKQLMTTSRSNIVSYVESRIKDLASEYLNSSFGIPGPTNS